MKQESKTLIRKPNEVFHLKEEIAMYRKSIKILNETGLHARPASLFIKAATKFESDIHIKFLDKMINAKSIVAILSSGISCGSEIEICVEGCDEKEAMKELLQLINSNFGEAS